jgi:surface polysaccharide O-acyltransferase-like enzyme
LMVLNIPLTTANQSTSSQFIAFFIFQMATRNPQPFESKRINHISKLMFGIYIIHNSNLSPISALEDGYPLVQLFGITSYSVYYLPFLIAAMVFFVSMILEFLRQLLFRKVKTLISSKPV